MLELDQPSLVLLGALHHGCRAQLVEEDGTPLWRVVHHNSLDLIPEKGKQTTPAGALPESWSSIIHRIDRWNGLERDRDLVNGLRLIRGGVVRRVLTSLEMTAYGRAVAGVHFGEGVDHAGVEIPSDGRTAVDHAIVETAAEIEFYPRIAATPDLRVRRLQDGGGIEISVSARDAKLSSIQPLGAVRTMIAMLGEAGRAATPMDAELGTAITLRIGDRNDLASLPIASRYDEAVVALPAPAHRLLREHARHWRRRRRRVRAGSGPRRRAVEVAGRSGVRADGGDARAEIGRHRFKALLTGASHIHVRIPGEPV